MNLFAAIRFKVLIGEPMKTTLLLSRLHGRLD